MLFHATTLALTASFLTTVTAAPFTFPLANGFPNVTNSSLSRIEHKAGGALPNSPPTPSKNISAQGITNLQLIAFNELFEVAFFSELIYNISSNVSSYALPGWNTEYVLESLRTIKNQEELHALNANNALRNFGQAPIQPCEYDFPVDNIVDAIQLADTFTDVVLGTLQDVQFIFATNDDANLVPGVGSVIGQEGEQEGFYRVLLGKKPSSSPFLTTGAREFAFTAIQGFTVAGSCPSLSSIDLTTFQGLSLLTQKPEANKDSTLHFAVGTSLTPALVLENGTFGGYSVVYITGQDVPIVEPIKIEYISSVETRFSAPFPFLSKKFNDGLTVAAVTKGSGPFADAQAVADATVFGPAFIEVN